jgi:hypothetical protein
MIGGEARSSSPYEGAERVSADELVKDFRALLAEGVRPVHQLRISSLLAAGASDSPASGDIDTYTPGARH